MAKNVIIMIGDGMGWEMARAAAIQKQIDEGKTGDTLGDFYVSGKGEGLSFQALNGYSLATTSTTYVDGDTGNSLLQGNPFNHVTGLAPRREGVYFDPSPAQVEGFFPELRDEDGFDEDPIVAGPGGKFEGGNLAFYDVNQGPELPWERRGETIDGTDGVFDFEYVKNLYPDSANTATTLYSGEKSYSGAIGVELHEHDLLTLGEMARALGKSFGAVSSVPFNHATPASAIAAVNQRNKTTEESVSAEVDEFGDTVPNSDNILFQILNESKPELLLGAGHTDTRGGDGRYLDQTTLDELRAGEYDLTFLERGENAGQTLLETASKLNVNEGDRLFGVYGALGQGGNLPWRTANSDYSNTGFESRTDATRPLAEGQSAEAFIAQEMNYNATLMDMTTAALDVLGDDEDGFWATIEGGDIDWSMHDNNLDNAIGTMFDFADSVQIVQDWIAENGGYEENLLVVTADHDHYLTLTDDFPRLLREFGAEALTTEVDNESGLAIVDVNVDENGTPILDAEGNEVLVKRDNTDAPASGHYWGSDPDVKYGWGTHTTIPVPVYYQGDGSDLLDGLVGEGFTSYGYQIAGIEGHVDQSHIAFVQAMSLTDTESYVSGTDANDTAVGTEMADLLVGRYGRDRLTGGAGNDVIFGDVGNDIIYGDSNGAGGAAGDDILFGGEGRDVMYGEGGNDQLVGDDGNDVLYGGEGDDLVYGGMGKNKVYGEAGSDTFVMMVGGDTRVMDFTAGEDVIGLMAGVSFGQLSIEKRGQNVLISVGDEIALRMMNTAVDSLTESAFVTV